MILNVIAITFFRSKGLAKLGNIVAETMFLVMFPGVAKLAGNKQNVLQPRWLNEETLFLKTNELRMRAMIKVRGKIEVREKHGVQPTKSQKNSYFVYDNSLFGRRR